MSDVRALPTAARAFDERAYEFCLVVITDPDPDVPPAAVVLYNADGIRSAIGMGRRVLAECPGPDDRYGELYVRHGGANDFLTTVHLGG